MEMPSSFRMSSLPLSPRQHPQKVNHRCMCLSPLRAVIPQLRRKQSRSWVLKRTKEKRAPRTRTWFKIYKVPARKSTGSSPTAQLHRVTPSHAEFLCQRSGQGLRDVQQNSSATLFSTPLKLGWNLFNDSGYESLTPLGSGLATRVGE